MLTCLKDAFEAFLRDFKCTPEQTITTALGNINIADDDLSDDEDLMADDNTPRRPKERSAPTHKYQEILQRLADRKQSEIMIDLDDLYTVRSAWLRFPLTPWEDQKRKKKEKKRKETNIAMRSSSKKCTKMKDYALLSLLRIILSITSSSSPAPSTS